MVDTPGHADFGGEVIDEINDAHYLCSWIQLLSSTG